MISDSERREAARRLRDMRLKPWDDTACEIASCVGIVCCNSECHGSDETPECARALCDRLADLIEPPTQCPYYHSDRHYCSAYDDVVDRDALLALADELEEDASWEIQTPGNASVRRMKDTCDRIREALGVRDA